VQCVVWIVHVHNKATTLYGAVTWLESLKVILFSCLGGGLFSSFAFFT